MRSLTLQFLSDSGFMRLAASPVSGFSAVAQNALVNLLTPAGSDLVFEDRGTSILARSLAGGYVDTRAAEHAANFAAADTLFFSREHERAAADDKLADLRLGVVSLSLVTLSLRFQFVSVGGETFNTELQTTSS